MSWPPEWLTKEKVNNRTDLRLACSESQNIGDWEQFDVEQSEDGHVTIASYHGYVVADEDNQDAVNIDQRQSRKTAYIAKWIIEDHPSGGVALKSVIYGRYLRAHDAGGGGVDLKATEPGLWERFLKLDADEGRVAFQAPSGDYLTAEQY